MSMNAAQTRQNEAKANIALLKDAIFEQYSVAASIVWEQNCLEPNEDRMNKSMQIIAFAYDAAMRALKLVTQ